MVLLGCVADDFTGATDLANTLVQGGMRTVQLIGTPETDAGPLDADAIVVALKSRTASPAAAVDASVDALRWLRRAGAKQYLFKYCSTFDSTDAGNIGPVADALLAELEQAFTIACPAFPATGRTVYHGHLFVKDQLLSDSAMRHHPLTPMTDANLVRVLGRQTAGRVGLIPYEVVSDGSRSIRAARRELEARGYRYAVVDAVEERHLEDLGAACADLPLVTGASGVAMGLPGNFRRAGLLGARDDAPSVPSVGGYAAVLAGSCSEATLAQVAEAARQWPAYFIDPVAADAGKNVVAEALSWAEPRLRNHPVVIYSSAAPAEVANTQRLLGRQRAGQVIEEMLAAIAVRLVSVDVRRLVIAGGETAGAVVQALGVGVLRIGPQIAPGVPLTVSVSKPPIALVLKSGNFGAPRFFIEALEMAE